VLSAISEISPLTILAAMVLTLGNYVLRGARWLLYSRAVGIHVPTRSNLHILASGWA
jgi:uncharacterized membrane protein YbhN (UPF0104 family)